MRSLRLAGFDVVRALAPVLFLIAAPGCSTYRDDLARSQRALEENQHETALGILRMLEPDTSHLDTDERARYAYLRGMTDYRIGYKADARHWLAVAKAMDEKRPGIIPEDWRSRLDQSLAQLDTQVWTAGMESLTTETAADRKHTDAARKRRKKKPDVAAPPAEEEEEEQAPKAAPKKKPAATDEDE